MAAEKRKILIVGCGPGAEACITPEAEAAAMKADVLIVSKRLQGLFPECAAERIDSGTDVPGILEVIAQRRDAGRQVVVLATGDPGIASLAQPVIRRFGRGNCEVIPGISSIQVAFARLGLDWRNVRIVTAPSEAPGETAEELFRAEKLVILGGRDGSLRWATRLIAELGEGRRVFLCENLTLPDEIIREVRAGELNALPISTRALLLVLREELLR